MDPGYSIEAKEATGLLPASYLVAAIRPMESESIVSSAVSYIAMQTLTDSAIDAVVTYQLPKFTLAGEGEPNYKLSGTFADRTPLLEPATETGLAGRSSRTYDDMNIVFWVGLALMSLTAAFLVFLLWNRRKRLMLALGSIIKKRRRGR